MISLPHPELPKDRKFYALIGGNLVILALIGWFAIRPILGMLTVHTTEITKTKAEITAMQTKAAELRKLKDTYPQYEQTYAPIIQNLPRTKDVAGYQTQLEDLARATTTQLITVDTSAAKPGATQAVPTQAGGFPTVPVKVDVGGTYVTILDFVQRVEKMNRFTRVVGLDLKSDRSGAVKATIDLQTLYIPT